MLRNGVVMLNLYQKSMTYKVHLISFLAVSGILVFLFSDKVAHPPVETNPSEREVRKNYVNPTRTPSPRNKEKNERENQFELLLHDPLSARSFLLDAAETPEFDSLIRDLSPELILQYLETQEIPYLRDRLNSRVYFILQKEAMRTNPEQIVVNMKRLGTRWLEPSLFGEVFAEFVMSNKDKELEFLGNLIEVPYSIDGELYFKELRNGNYSYIEGVDALYEYNPNLAYAVALDFFAGLRGKEEFSSEISLLMTVKEKSDLINFIRRRYESEYSPAELIKAVEDLPLLE
jgi:hypothetical protein